MLSVLIIKRAADLFIREGIIRKRVLRFALFCFRNKYCLYAYYHTPLLKKSKPTLMCLNYTENNRAVECISLKVEQFFQSVELFLVILLAVELAYFIGILRSF